MRAFFLIIIVSVLFILENKYKYSILLIAASFVPLGIYGLISIFNGWYFLPNSLVLKSVLTGNEPFLSEKYIFNIFNHFVNQLLVSKLLILISLSFSFLVFNLINRKFKDLCSIMLFIFISMALFHLLFANIGWFYRYEAYLVFMGVLVNSLVLYQFFQKYKISFDRNNIFKYLVFLLLLSLIIIPLAHRGYDSFDDTPIATHNIYEQQYQMGLFVKRFYHNESIVLNDIGQLIIWQKLNVQIFLDWLI